MKKLVALSLAVMMAACLCGCDWLWDQNAWRAKQAEWAQEKSQAATKQDPSSQGAKQEQPAPEPAQEPAKEQQSEPQPAQRQQVQADTYESILDNYSNRLREAAPRLASEFTAESEGVGNIQELAKLSNEKVSALAEISNEGVTKMAEVMYRDHDDYATYEGWAQKLTDVYMDQGKLITDAYMSRGAQVTNI